VTERIRAGRRTIEITHPDRVVFPEAGLTKLDLARHYDRVAPVMVPHVRDRPVAMDSYPQGVDHPGYYVKQIPGHFPRWIRRVTVPKRGGEVTHVLTGADRIAANGDTANKVGTYPLAVLAERHGIPFVVVAPTSTVDLATPTGAEIPIEERDAAEVSERFPARNPAFDVTPAGLITAIVTENGVHRPSFSESLAVAA